MATASSVGYACDKTGSTITTNTSSINSHTGIAEYSISQTDTTWTLSLTKVTEGDFIWSIYPARTYAIYAGIGTGNVNQFNTGGIVKVGYLDKTESNQSFNVSKSVSVTKTKSSQTVSYVLYIYVENDAYGYSMAAHPMVVTFTVPAKTSYAVTYNANGGSGTTSNQTKWYNESLTLQSNGYTYSGFTFKRWNTNSSDSGTPYNAGASYTSNAELALYAIWNHTVSFDANGGSGAPSSQTALKGSAITLSSTKPTRTNYVFKHWYTNKNDSGGTAYSPGGTFAANTANTTLYAIWYAPYSVVFDANGGSGAPGNQVKVYNTNLTLSSTQPTYTGYTFKRWNTSTADTGTAYNPGATYSSNANLVLYAIWNHVVTYNANGGSNPPSSQVALKGSAITLTSSKPTKTSHLFVKWNTKADGTGTDYSPGDTFAANTVNTTLYAIWEFYEKPNVTSLLCTRVDSAYTYALTEDQSPVSGKTYYTYGESTGYVEVASPDASAMATYYERSGGNLDDEGEYMLVRVVWMITNYHSATTPASISISALLGTTTTDSETITQFSGTVSGNYAIGTTETILDGPFDTEERYNVTVSVTDALNTTTFTDVLTEAFYPFDVLAGGHGASFGKPAKNRNILDVGYSFNADGVLSVGGYVSDDDMATIADLPLAISEYEGITIYQAAHILVSVALTRVIVTSTYAAVVEYGSVMAMLTKDDLTFYDGFGTGASNVTARYGRSGMKSQATIGDFR